MGSWVDRLELPAGHRLVSIADRPGLVPPVEDHNVAVWPEFMLHAEIANRYWDHCWTDYPQFQFVLLGPDDAIIATNNAMPLDWDQTDAGLPTGWDEQVLRSVADLSAGRPVNTLGAMQIVVAKEAQGGRHAGTMVLAMREAARAAGHRALIACVRPTLKPRYPLQSIEDYADWMRPDGLPFDPWIRLHVRLGGRISRPSPESMVIRAPIESWERWTGMAFPASGSYVIEGATSPVRIDRSAGDGVYFDQNVWIVHEL